MAAHLSEGDACCPMCRQLLPNLKKFEEKFRAKVEVQPSGCHLWRGAINSRSGYGYLALGSTKKINAHRFAWILSFGPIADALDVCHRCDVRDCVNVDHLFLGTRKENLDDMRSKGRHSHGESHWTRLQPWRRAERSAARGTISAETAAEIRKTYAEGRLSQSQVAAKFGVGRSLVLSVLRQSTWKDAGGDKVDGKAIMQARVEAKRSEPCSDCGRPKNWNGKVPNGSRCSSCFSKFRYSTRIKRSS